MIRIALICDKNYILPTMTTVYSIYINRNSNNRYCVYLICSNDDVNEVSNICKIGCDGFSVEAIGVDCAKVMNIAKNDGASYAVATEMALFKFFLPDILSGIEKVLYIDSDVIVKKDIFELYKMNVDDVCAIAVKDSGKLYSKRKVVCEKENYFNTGVMLLNLNKLKEYTEKLVDEKLSQEDHTLMDQDVFNVVIGDDVETIDNRFNLLYTNLVRARSKYSMSQLRDFYDYDYKSLKDLYEDAYIVHFASKDKPWNNTTSPMSRLWYEYYQGLKKLSFIDEDLFTLFEEERKKDIRLYNCLSGQTQIQNKRVIVSLTTFPARIDKLIGVVESLLTQIEIPDKILVVLTKEEFPEEKKELSSELIEFLESSKIDIVWGDRNLKPHNKYYYTMRMYPDDVIITVDDDVSYSDDLIWRLYQSYMRFPNEVSAMRVHLIDFENGMLKNYVDWKQELESPVGYPSISFLATGVSGCLYPPKCMHEDVFDVDLMMSLCPTVDDIWLKIMQIRVGTSVVLACPCKKINIIKGTQSEALYRINRAGGGNDKYLQKILDYYDVEKIKDKLISSYNSVVKKVKQPAVSVILPVCDSKAKIRPCLESLVKQSLRNVEFIFVDNGSKSKILNEYAMKYPNISLITDKSLNVSKAANKGIEEAKGEYLLIADSDTVYMPNYLFDAYYLISRDNTDVVCSKVDYCIGNINDYTSYRKSSWEDKQYLFPKESVFTFGDIRNNRFDVVSYRLDDKFFSRKIVSDNRFDENGDIYGDIMFVYKTILSAEKIAYNNSVVGHYLVNFENPHHLKCSWNNIKHSIIAFRDYLQQDQVGSLYYQDYMYFIINTAFREYELINDMKYAEKRYYNLVNDIKEMGADRFAENLSDETLSAKYFYVSNFKFPSELLSKNIGIESNDTKLINDKLKIKDAEIKQLRSDIQKLNRLLNENNFLIEGLRYDSYCLNETRKSKSYKIGLFITLIPRWIRRMIAH